VPIDGRTDYAAQWVSQRGPAALESGQSGTATITFRNEGTKTLHRAGPNPTRCRVSRPRDGRSEWLDVTRENTVLNASGDPIGVKMDQDDADPGDNFTCTFHVIAPNKGYGLYPEYFSPVAEDKAWLLPRDDVYLPFSIANETHVVYPESAYSSSFVRQEGPLAALAPGETGKLRLTFRNTGTATLFNTGTNPTNCRPSNPRDRQSRWVTQATPIDQNRVAPGDGFTCTIPIKAPTQYGTYDEYFSPVTEGKAWMFDNGVDDVHWPLAVADPDHVIWPFHEYAATWVNQDYPHKPLQPGETGTVKFTFMNSGRPTLYNTGTNPTYCRPSHPPGRQSLWVDKPTLIDQSRVGRGERFTCTITVTAPAQRGTYNEYFSPWTKDKGWMFNNGFDDVWVPLTSG
jgi:hypothetical protein